MAALDDAVLATYGLNGGMAPLHRSGDRHGCDQSGEADDHHRTDRGRLGGCSNQLADPSDGSTSVRACGRFSVLLRSTPRESTKPAVLE